METLPQDGAAGRFDYAALGDIAEEARAAAERIRSRLRASVIETGRDLIAIKARLEHGQFLTWIEAECLLTYRTVARMMSVAKCDMVSYLENDGKLNNVEPTVLYALASPATPAPVREEVLARISAGEPVVAGEVKAAIKAEKEKAALARRRKRDEQGRTGARRTPHCATAAPTRQGSRSLEGDGTIIVIPARPGGKCDPPAETNEWDEILADTPSKLPPLPPLHRWRTNVILPLSPSKG